LTKKSAFLISKKEKGKMLENEQKETGKMMALMLVLMNIFILTAIAGVFFLIQIILDQASQLNAWVYGFRL
jgi:uncharacterized membrane protein YqjE